MMDKPDKCCMGGSYEHTIPIPIRGRVQYVDFCIADLVAALNAANIETIASCCGHGKMDGNILLYDGRIITIKYPGDVAEPHEVPGGRPIQTEPAGEPAG